MRMPFLVAAVFLSLLGGNLRGSTTILKFGFGADDFPDFQGVDGIVSTVDDGDAATPGDQNTEIAFLGPFAGTPSIALAHGSITFDRIVLTNATATIGDLVLQPTSGGNFKIWDDTNSLLLSGTLGDGLLTGSLSGTSTAALFALDFGTFEDGSLHNQLEPTSLAFSLSFVGVTAL